MKTSFGLVSVPARVAAAVGGMFLGGCLGFFELRRLVSNVPEPRSLSADAIIVCLLGAVVAVGIMYDAWRSWRTRASVLSKRIGIGQTRGTVADFFAKKLRESNETQT